MTRYLTGEECSQKLLDAVTEMLKVRRGDPAPSGQYLQRCYPTHFWRVNLSEFYEAVEACRERHEANVAYRAELRFRRTEPSAYFKRELYREVNKLLRIKRY